MGEGAGEGKRIGFEARVGSKKQADVVVCCPQAGGFSSFLERELERGTGAGGEVAGAGKMTTSVFSCAGGPT